jgi:enoyl-CoA hydratase/carnithine racemase
MNATAATIFQRTDHGGVATIEINNPPTNLVDRAFVVELMALVDALSRDEATRVVVFRSAHADFFVNHFDMATALNQPNKAPPRPGMSPLTAVYQRLTQLPQVTIGEIRGRVRGAGGEFALALDMRFGALERAVFGQPEVGSGLLPGAGGTLRLPALLGRARALEVILSSNDYDALQAERYGWINRALPDAELRAFVDALATRIARFPAEGIRQAKQMVNAATPVSEQLLTDESQRFQAQMTRPEVLDRVKWLLAEDARTAGGVELQLGAALGRIPALPQAPQPE